MNYSDNGRPVRIANSRTRFALRAASATNKHRENTSRTFNPTPSTGSQVTLWTILAGVVGYLAGCGVEGAVNIVCPDTVGLVLGFATWGAAVAAPTATLVAARRATVDVPARLSGTFATAERRIAELAKHDPVTADRLHLELVGYVKAARTAVELDGGRYFEAIDAADSYNRRLGLWSPSSRELEGRISVRKRQLEEFIEASPIHLVVNRVNGIATLAGDALKVALDKEKFAEGPRREVEAAIVREREAARVRELTAAFEDAMNYAESLHAVHSVDIDKDVAAGREVIASLKA